MKKIIAPFLFGLTILCLYGFSSIPADKKEKVRWYTWEEAVEANKTEKRKIFLDIYTDWCGWCKRMDKATFGQKNVARYLNENFYPVKLDAEQKADIIFNDHTFSYVKSGRSGMHMLAYTLLEGQMSFPSVVYLSEKYERILISPGYKEPEDLMLELEYAKGEHYKNTKWENFFMRKQIGSD